MYDKILTRTFSRYEQRRFRYAALFAFLLVVASFFTVFKPYLGPLPLLNLGMSMDSGLKMLMTQDSNMFQNKGNFTASDDDLNPAENSTVSQFWEVRNDQLDRVGMKSESVSQAGNNTLQTVLKKPENATNSEFQPVLVTVVHESVDHGANISVVKSEVSCNFTLPRSNTCTINGDIRVNGVNGTILVPEIKGGNMNESWKLKPYARKSDKTAMEFVREWSVKSVSEKLLPSCSVNHSVPAIVFSNGGYSGNHFHDTTDTLIPLFLSAQSFNRDVKFLVTDYKISWLNKYRNILKKLSKYEIINIDKESDTHCFPKMILGLTSQKEFDINPSMPPYSSQKDYTRFIRDAFDLPRSNAINLAAKKGEKKPKLMIISRKSTRKLINIHNVVKMAKKIGFKVIVAEGNNTSNLSKFAELMNSCDVLLGIHGAGLTNIVFLPENAVFIQIVPLGMEWLSNVDFGQPARDMNLKYLDYQITKEESSLIQQYPADDIVFKNPFSFQQKSWLTFRAIYLDKQDIKVDVRRLQPLLVKAIELLHR